MDKFLENKVKKLIFEYSIKNNLVFYSFNRNSNWNLIKKIDFESQIKLINLNLMAINNEEDFIKLDLFSTYHPNCIVTIEGAKILQHIIKSTNDIEYKDIVMEYPFFCNFKQALSAIVSIDIKKAQYFFENAKNTGKSKEKLRNSEDEHKLLKKSLKLYNNKVNAFEGILSYLKNHFNHYLERYGGLDKQFVLKDFIDINFVNEIKNNSIDISKIEPYLTEFKISNKPRNNIFILESEKTYLIHIDKGLLYNHIPLLEIPGHDRSSMYKKIMKIVIDYLNIELKPRGVKSCIEIYGAEIGDDEKRSINLLFKLVGNEIIEEKEIKEIILLSTNFLSNNTGILNDQEKVKNLMNNFWKIEMKSNLEKELTHHAISNRKKI